jgi:hypothetical protein
MSSIFRLKVLHKRITFVSSGPEGILSRVIEEEYIIPQLHSAQEYKHLHIKQLHSAIDYIHLKTEKKLAS